MSMDAQRVLDAIEGFLASAADPQMIEPGEEPIRLESGNRLVELTSGRLTIQAWTRDRNLVRRVTGVAEQVPGRLLLTTERFGKRSGTLELIDVARPRNRNVTQRASRHTHRDGFRRSLSRQFPGWRIAEISADPDLENSLSPAYPRALLQRGNAGWAAIAAPEDGLNPDGALTFGLIWLDYLRRRNARLTVEGLALFLPETRERTTCLRLKHLDPAVARFSVFVTAGGQEQPIDISDVGNLDTKLHVRHSAFAPAAWMLRLASIPHVEAVEQSGGATSWRVRGLEFAVYDGSRFRFGLHGSRTADESSMHEVEALAWELGRMRSSEAADRRSPLYAACPERWLESQLRSSLPTIDAALLSSPIYGQVPAFAGGDRGVIDLLAAGFDGRLAVIEVKASEDVHLPLQSLDYWMRVQWHAERGDFSRHGYFPGVTLGRQAPRLLLVAPALGFHSTTETILRFFAPYIETYRIGLGMNWQNELKVVFRARGAETLT